MSDKNTRDALLVAQYKAVAASRLAAQKTMSASLPKSAGECNGVVTVRLTSGAKPMSAFGGVAEVLGKSRIRIPEYKTQHR